MADVLTAPYGLVKIEIGASENTWGEKINANFDLLDDLLDGTVAIRPNLQQSQWRVGGTAIQRTGQQINNLYHRGNIVGAVSFSGATPTGAIIESNADNPGANGVFVRWADGTQMCTHVLTASADDAVTWTFERAFSAVPTGLTVQPAGAGTVIGMVESRTASALTFSARSLAGARLAFGCCLTAWGRWA